MKKYAKPTDPNYWILAVNRPIEDKNYEALCNELMSNNNNDVKAIGKLLAALPPSRGIRLLLVLKTITISYD